MHLSSESPLKTIIQGTQFSIILMISIIIAVIYEFFFGHRNNYTGAWSKQDSRDYFRKRSDTYKSVLNELVLSTNDVPYEPMVDAPKSGYNRHHGQRKLFFAELQLILEALKIHNNDKDILFIYAGAAPCMYLGKLVSMFPKIKFLIIDPNEFLICNPDYVSLNINDKKTRFINQYDHPEKYIYLSSAKNDIYPTDKPKKIQAFDLKIYDHGSSPTIDNEEIIDFIKVSSKQVYLYEGYFTIDLAKSLKNDHFFNIFMSDIRTNGSGSPHPLEIDILWNNSQMFNWVHHMKPDIISHKHRVPIMDNDLGAIQDYMIPDFEESKRLGNDFVENFLEHKKYVFYDGIEYFQAWVSKVSAETRLVIIDHNKVNYNGSEQSLNSYGVPGSYTDIPDNYIPDNSFVKMPGVKILVRYYDFVCYDQKMMYHNRVNKGMKQFITEYHVYDNCFDCSLESKLMNDYKNLGIVADFKLHQESKNLHLYLGSKDGFIDARHSLPSIHNKKNNTKYFAHTTDVDLVSKRFKK